MTPAGAIPNARSLYVDALRGSDRNNGSFARPVRSINACATTAKAGQTCYVAGGTYREAVTPNSGITIRPMGTAAVILLATNKVKNWKVWSGNIYVAPVALSTSLPANQVFLGPGTTMLSEAQFPTPSRDPMHPNWALEVAGSNSQTVVDPKLPSGDLTGATVNIWSGIDPWTHILGHVTASGGGRLQFEGNNGNPCPQLGYCSMAGGWYYVTGSLRLLRGPGQWWYDQRRKLLYLWPPNGVNPNAKDVEAKQRDVLIDLSGRSGVVIKGLKLVGGGIFSGPNSHDDTIDGISASYISQVLYANDPLDPYATNPRGSGIVLDGSHNTLENSIIAYSATNGVVLLGRGNTVTNNLIHDVDWLGDYAAGVWPETGDHVISYNTIYNTGRSAVTFGPMKNLDIGENNFYNAELLSVDSAAIYGTGDGNGSQLASGTRIHDNWLQGGPTAAHRTLPPSNTCTCNWAGTYIDYGLSGVLVDHNVVWDSYPGIIVGGRSGYPTAEVHLNFNTIAESNEPSIVLYGFHGDQGTEASNNRIYTPIQTDQSSKNVPLHNNTSTAPGAGSIARPGCSLPGCGGAEPP